MPLRGAIEYRSFCLGGIMEKEVLNTKEAAALLGITQQMVRISARRGKIKAYHPFEGCKKFVFRRSELLAGMMPAED